jgi:putative DNA primase/helicase
VTLDEFLTRIPSARKSGKQWQARCPAHPDRKASLSIGSGDKGIVLKCHRGCETVEVLSAIGLRLQDLMSHRDDRHAAPQPRRRAVATYDYRDEGGKLLFQALRYEPKDFRQRRPDGRGGWYYNLDGVRRVLYRLPELIASAPAALVFVAEGEKDVERLRALGLAATCNPQGAGKWREEYGEALRGRSVVILPDNDRPGEEHAEQVAVALYRVAQSVKVLRLPNLPPKGDVSDWLDAGGAADHLLEMAEACPAWHPTTEAEPTNEADENPALLRTWAEFERLELVHGERIIHELERGELALLAAVTNAGKSTLLRNLAIRLASGSSFEPLVGHGQQRRVLILDFETRAPRMQDDLARMAMNCTHDERAAVRVNLALVCDAFVADEPLSLSHPRHFDFIRAQAFAFRADLIIVDTISAAFEIRDENSNGEVNSRVLKPLYRLARDTGAAILMAHHIGKGNENGDGAERAYRARGASSFGAYAALVLNLGKDSHDKTRRVLSNPKAKGAEFEDAVLQIDPATRWMSVVGVPVNDPPTSYRLVLDLLADGREMKTHGVIAALAGQVAERTIKLCLAEGVKKGDLECPRRGAYRKVQVVQSPIAAAQLALSGKPAASDSDDSELVC